MMTNRLSYTAYTLPFLKYNVFKGLQVNMNT